MKMQDIAELANEITRTLRPDLCTGLSDDHTAFLEESAKVAAVLRPLVSRADRLALCLQLIVDKHDCASELFTSDKELADNLRDTAALALKQDRNDHPQTPRP